MKILLTSNLYESNPVIYDLYQHLSPYVSIQASVKSFWDVNPLNMYDIVHIQWPEQLFGWQLINEEDLRKLISQLKLWKGKGSKIVITRHNISPHILNKLYQEAYKIIYGEASAVIHFSEASIKNFNLIYANNRINSKILHEVIFHPMYINILNSCSRKEARKFLKINDNKNVILIFGEIRHKKEREFILNVFKKLELTHKFMLIPRWFSLTSSKYIFLKRLFIKFKLFINKFSRKTMLQCDFVPEDKIQFYMNASDIIFIPRFEVLNSGVLMLAYSFNKIVVGPSTGSIRELLELSKNPSYQINDIDDAISKIKEGFELSKTNIDNYSFAEKNMNWNIIIKKHLLLYKEIM